jgi:hypothetical protein
MEHEYNVMTWNVDFSSFGVWEEELKRNRFCIKIYFIDFSDGCLRFNLYEEQFREIEIHSDFGFALPYILRHVAFECVTFARPLVQICAR